MVNFRRDISYSSDDSKESLRGSAISKLVAVPKGIVKYWPDIAEKLHIDIVLDKRRETRLIDRLGRNGLKRVFECLLSKCDQRALALTDKSTYLLLLPLMYNTITIDLAEYPHSTKKIEALLDKKNNARRFIRRVFFDGSNLKDKSRPPSGACRLLTLFSHALPYDQLEVFSWPVDFVLDPLETLRLWENHTSIQNLEVYQATLLWCLNDFKNAMNVLDNVKSLRISPDNKEGLRNITTILKMVPIKELHLDLRSYKPNTNGFVDENSVVRDGVTCYLFKHTLPLLTCPMIHQLQLSRLVLWNVNLYHAQRTWSKVLHRNCLKELEIHHCKHAGNFLENLDTNQCMIESFKIFHTSSYKNLSVQVSTEISFDKQLEKFLTALAVGPHESHPASSTSDEEISRKYPGGAGMIQEHTHRLKKLQIKLRGEAFHAFHFFPAVALHAPALEILKLDFKPILVPGKDDNSNAYEALSHVLSGCKPESHSPKLLRQLAVPLHACTAPVLEAVNPSTFFLKVAGPLDPQVPVKLDPLMVANTVLETLLKVHGDACRLKVVAVQNQDAKGEEGLETFLRCQVHVLGREKEMMCSAPLGDLRKGEGGELDVLESEPIAFGPEGRV